MESTGVSDMAGYAAKVAVERCGWQPRYNGPENNLDREILELRTATK